MIVVDKFVRPASSLALRSLLHLVGFALHNFLATPLMVYPGMYEAPLKEIFSELKSRNINRFARCLRRHLLNFSHISNKRFAVHIAVFYVVFPIFWDDLFLSSKIGQKSNLVCKNTSVLSVRCSPVLCSVNSWSLGLRDTKVLAQTRQRSLQESSTCHRERYVRRIPCQL